MDGPPYTTGYIHLGTSWNKTIKDTYHPVQADAALTMSRDQPGYDMHGLPIEVKVEQSIGVKNKKEIEEYGIDRFVSTCKDFALELPEEDERAVQGTGRLDGLGQSLPDHQLELHRGGLVDAEAGLRQGSAGHRRTGCSPGARAARPPWPRRRSSTRDEKDPSIYVKFPLKDEEDVSLLIWTTTPWTLPANMAVAAHPDFRYAKVTLSSSGETETVIVLKSLVEQIGRAGRLGEVRDPASSSRGRPGRPGVHTAVLETRSPTRREATGKWVHQVIPSKTVEAENTGLVHIAPGHGPEDFELGKEFGLEPFCPVDETGRFTNDLPPRYAGMHVKKANKHIIEELKERQSDVFSGTIEHRYRPLLALQLPDHLPQHLAMVPQDHRDQEPHARGDREDSLDP